MLPVTDATQDEPSPADEKIPLQIVDHAKENKSRPSRWRRWAIGVVVVLIIAGMIAYQMIASHQADALAAADRDVAAAATTRLTVIGLATLQPRDGILLVAVPSGSAGAAISHVMVKVGDTVAQGQVLAHVDTEPKLKAAIAQAKAGVALRMAERARTLASIQSEQDGANAAYGVAQVLAANTRRVSSRAITLTKTNAMSSAQRDNLIAASQQADGELEEARVRLARYNGSPEIHPDVVAADAAVDAARAALAAAETDLEQSVVIAPTNGTILSISARAGERPGTEGILRMADTTAMVAKVEVFQSRIHTVSIGDPVTLASEALITPLLGTVSAIGSEVLPQGQVSDDAAANTNARVIEVTVSLDAASTLAANSLTNLQVLATIMVGVAQ